MHCAMGSPLMLPLDPPRAKMLLIGGKFGCASEALTIVSIPSVF